MLKRSFRRVTKATVVNRWSQPLLTIVAFALLLPATSGALTVQFIGLSTDDPDWCRTMEAKIPLGRFGRMEDLVGAAIFLSSDASAYVTGQYLGVDGGYLASI